MPVNIESSKSTSTAGSSKWSLAALQVSTGHSSLLVPLLVGLAVPRPTKLAEVAVVVFSEDGGGVRASHRKAPGTSRRPPMAYHLTCGLMTLL